MTLADRRFGAELVLATGRVLPFDDTGCLITFLETDSVAAAGVHSIQVASFLAPHALLDAAAAVFLLSDSIHTPMDYHIAALSREHADSVRAALGGELVTWDQARAMIRASGTSR
jgi:copper chaperone NosL